MSRVEPNVPRRAARRAWAWIASARGAAGVACALLVVLAFCASVGAQEVAGSPGKLGTLDGLDEGTPERGAGDEIAAEVPADPFTEACRAYRAGSFDRALFLFARAAEREPDQARRALLHADAGTAAARANRLGEAVWHLEAALRGAPRDAVAHRNLAMVRAQLPDGGDLDDPSDFTASLLRLPLLLTERETSTLLAAVGGLALLLLAGWRARRLSRGAAWAAFVLLLLDGSLLLFSDAARADDLRRAVVVEQVEVRGEPAADARTIVVLGPGVVVRDEETRGGWRLVETSGGGRGWVPSDAVRAAGR